MKILGGAAILIAAQAVSYGLSFLRNVLLARVLTKEDFGFAATFSICIALVEIAGKMSFAQQLVTTEEHEVEDYLASSHFLQLTLGLLSGCLLLVLAPHLAQLFGVPDKASALRLLSFVPFLRAFENIGTQIEFRNLRYKNFALCEALPQAIVTIVTLALLIYVKSYTVIIVATILKSASTTIITHCISVHRWRMKPNRVRIATILTFNAPLILSGFVTFLGQQGDQAVVGAVFSVADLANVSICATLISVPWFILAKAVGTLMTPLFASKAGVQLGTEDRLSASYEAVTLIAITVFLPLALLGSEIVHLVYGSRYSELGSLIVFISVSGILRLIRIVPVTFSLAQGRSGLELMTSSTRLLALAAVFLWPRASLTPQIVCAIGAFSELVSTGICLRALNRNAGIKYSTVINANIHLAVCFCLIGILYFIKPSFNSPMLTVISVVFLTVLLAFSIYNFSSHSQLIKRTLMARSPRTLKV